MQPSDVIALWLPNGRFVTRWKEQRPNAGNAVVAKLYGEMHETLAKKFGQDVLKNIGIFSFLGWASADDRPPEEREMMPEPVVAFGSVLSRAELKARLREVMDMVENGDEGPYWVELFVRSRTPVDDEQVKARFRNRPVRRRVDDHPEGGFRRS